MDISQFCTRLNEALHPAVYRGFYPEAAPFALLLRHINSSLGRYAFGVLPWDTVEDKSRLLRTARRGISKHMFTIPYLWQVGLYLVVVGPSREWSPLAKQMAADQTSLRSVIVNAVHFIDLESGVKEVRRSQWGPIVFGGTVSVTEVVDSIVAEQIRI